MARLMLCHVALALSLAGCQVVAGLSERTEGTAGVSGVGGSAVNAGGDAGNGAAVSGGSGGSGAASIPELEPPFLGPNQVWQRISLLLFDEARPPPLALPEVTTYAWAGSITLAAFDGDTPGTSRGLERLLRRWLEMPKTSDFAADWPSLVRGQPDVLTILLTKQLTEPHRAGVLTEPAFLTAHPTTTKRGAAMFQAFWHDVVPPNPPNTGTLEPSASETKRDALVAATKDPACQACHQLTDQLGFSLENFDPMGVWQSQENGLPIDNSGVLAIPGAASPQPYMGLQALAAMVAHSSVARFGLVSASYVDALTITMQVAENPPIAERDLPERQRVAEAFEQSDLGYRALMQAIAQSKAILK